MLLEAGTWPGWRGGELEANAPSDAIPFHWNAQSNIVWRAEALGDGFSSPVVSDDLVYFTSVTKWDWSRGMSFTLEATEYLLLLVLLASAVYLLTSSGGTGAAQEQPLGGLLARVVFAGLLGLAISCVLFGEKLANFGFLSGSPRVLLSSVCILPCVLLAVGGLLMVRGKMRNLILGGFCLLLAAGSLVKAAQKLTGWEAENPWRRPSALAMGMCLTACGLFYIGRALVSIKLSKSSEEAVEKTRPAEGSVAPPSAALPAGADARRSGPFLYVRRWIADFGISRPEGLPVREHYFKWTLCGLRIAWMVIPIIALGLMFTTFATSGSGLGSRADVNADEFHTVRTFDVYEPRVPLWILGAVLCPALVGLAVRHQRAGAWLAEPAILLSAMLAAPVGAVVLLEAGLVRLSYLRHVLLTRQPTLGTAFGWRNLLIGLACVMGAILFVRVKRPRLPEWTGLAKVAFRLAAAVLSVTCWLSWAGIPRPPQDQAEQLSVVAMNRATGSVSWVEPFGPAPVKFNRLNSRTTPTPAIWSNRVCAYFGTQGLACFDRTGKKLWSRMDIPFDSEYGAVVSPIVCGGRVILDVEPPLKASSKGKGYIVGVDCETGQIAWKNPRPESKNGDGGNCRTPLVLSSGGRKLILVWGGEEVTAYDPVTGKEEWTYNIPGAKGWLDLIASPCADSEKLYLPTQGEIIALRIANLGTKAEPLLWRCKCPGLDCSSPVAANGFVFAVTDQGRAFCVDGEAGELLWSKKLKGTHFSSPIVAGGCVYFCNVEGLTTVIKCARECQVVGENDLKERVMTSFAAVDGRLFIRTQANLFCIGDGAEGGGKTPGAQAAR
jgi:outer membrane protein assembly factor BamB